MKGKIAKLTLMFLVIGYGTSVAQINTPAASAPGSASTRVGLTDIEINYFRPSVKGREIFGAGDQYLQQYGSLWRTGANSGSKISFSTDVKVAGEEVKAGEYLIFTIPGEKEWSFMLYKDLSIGGNVGSYNEEHEVLKTTVEATTLAEPVETFTIQIADISADNTNANIHLTWSNVSLKVPVEVNFDEVVMAEIAAKTRVNPQNYAQAASYYFNSGKDLNKALEWINLYLAEEGNDQHFWFVHLKAQILAKMNKKKEAIATAKKSMETAKASEGGDFGYVKRNEMLIQQLNN